MNKETDKIDYFCTKCNAKIKYGQQKCSGCGDALEWDDVEVSEGQETSASVDAKRYATASIIFVITGVFLVTPLFAITAIIFGFRAKRMDESAKTLANIGIIAGIAEFIIWAVSVVIILSMM